MRCSFRTRIVVLAVVLPLALAALVSAPGAVAAGRDRVGATISIFGGAIQTFPAGQPFHFEHGWGLQPGGDHALGKFGFSLTVDGVEVKRDFLDTIPVDDPLYGRILSRHYVFNFPDGMTGTHVFGGTYFGPCQGFVNGGFATGPCSKPNETISTSGSPFTITVTFIP